MQLKLPKQLMDWIMESRGDTSPQGFIIDQLFAIKQTAKKNEGVIYDTEEENKVRTYQ
jgi:hypothetical protein